MTTLLHVSASPRGPASDSLAPAQAFLDSHRASNPDVEVDHLDLHDGSLPPFGTLAAGAKMAVFGGGQPSASQAAAWDAARAVYDRCISLRRDPRDVLRAGLACGCSWRPRCGRPLRGRPARG